MFVVWPTDLVIVLFSDRWALFSTSITLL